METATLVIFSIACGTLVYFTTRSLIAAWLLGQLILRTLQLLRYRFLSCALRNSTVDHATTRVFHDFGASLFDCSLLRFFSICPLSGVTSYLSSCSFDVQLWGSDQYLFYWPSVETSTAGRLQSGKSNFGIGQNTHMHICAFFSKSSGQSCFAQGLLDEVILAEMSFDDLESMHGSRRFIAFAAQRKVARVVNAFEKFFFC